jgi:GTPase SAR1 family protein
MTRDEQHCAAIETYMFGTAEAPEWLASSVRDCQSRYQGLSLTEEFQSAVNAFAIAPERKPFELFVVGEGKFGKSTLVNCLLGEELSRVRVLPETRCFLRYVLKDEPSRMARFYVRPKQGVHDWLLKRLGAGRTVPELYQVSEHEVGLAEAKGILAEETKRLDSGGYDPAVLEVERDVKRNARSAFQSEVRVVDTQGLDQLFPDELKKQTAGLSEISSQKLFIEWMNTTPRGKYLEWQFRRCDSVLWCISAKRIGSAATAAALRYFSAYSKKIVIALTAVDLVAKKDGDMERLLARAEQLYGDYAIAICPVNGRKAWEALTCQANDELDACGFSKLVTTIESICISQGNRVRNLSWYFAIRRTERQYRNSLRVLHRAYEELDARYKLDRRNLERARSDAIEAMTPVLRDLFAEICDGIVERTGQVSLSDDQSDAERKVGFSLAGKSASSAVTRHINDMTIPQLIKVGGAIAPYSLPSFDADGQVSGSLLRVEFQPPRTILKEPSLPFSFSLESMWGKAVWLKFCELFGSKKALTERMELERQRRGELTAEFRKHWNSYHAAMARAVTEQIERLYEIPLKELDRVFARVEREAGGPLPAAAKKIKTALASVAVQPVISNGMIRAIERVRHGRIIAHQFA